MSCIHFLKYVCKICSKVVGIRIVSMQDKSQIFEKDVLMTNAILDKSTQL